MSNSNQQQILYILMDNTEPVGVYTDKALADKDCWDCNTEAGYTDEGKNYPDFWVSTAPLCSDFINIPSPAED